VLASLTAGERRVVTGAQAVKPGHQVRSSASNALANEHLRLFIDRRIFAGVPSALILLAGVIVLFRLSILEYRPVVPPSVVVHPQ
jgi:hypothetical protein